MAERRMFAKTIIDSDAFLDMPLSAQALYFHLSMRADDDGFVNNPKRIQKVIGSNDDDFNVLIAKNFVLKFESGIIVIKHWKIHNYIRNDRKKDTAYPEEMALLEVKDNGAYTFSKDLVVISDGEGIPQNAKDARKKAYEESTLPYSFDYKIRQAFFGKPCPICNIPMKPHRDGNIVTEIHKPTIQHNTPISKGGKHELGNISVVCHQCNVTIQDKETGALNADEVIKVWDRLTSDSQVTVNCPSSDSTGKDSIVKDSIVEDSIDNTICSEPNDSEPVITLTLNDKSEYPITQDMIDEYQELYPAVDVMQELRNMKGWCNSNPTRRKTKNGIKRFINSWLAKEQDKGFTPMPNKKQRVDEWSKA